MRQKITVSGGVAAFLLIFLLMLPNTNYPRRPTSSDPPGEADIDSLNVHRVGRALFEPMGAMDVRGDTLFMISYTDLVLFDISEPENPIPLAYYPTPGTPRDLTVGDGYAYVTMRKKGFTVMDRRDDYRWLSTYDPEAQTFRSVISGDVAYIVGKDSLHIVDVSDPSDVRLASKYACEEYFDVIGVTVVGDTCYVACKCGLRVLDAADPENPVELGSYDSSEFYIGVAVEDTLAYVLTSSALRVFDVGDLDDIREIGSVAIEYANVTEVRMYNTYLCVSSVWPGSTGGGIHIYDVTDPGNIEEISVIPMDDMLDYVVRGQYVYIANEYTLEIFDLSHTANPVEVGD